MFHRPKAEETEAQTQAVERPVVVAQQVAKAPVQQQVRKDIQQTEIKTEEKDMSNKEEQESKQHIVGRSIDIPGQPKPYQAQAAHTSPRIPGSYAYPGAQTNATPYGSSPSSSLAQQGRRLLISQGITMSGEIESCDYLLIEGTVEAALKGASVLEIAETGVFYGTVEIDEATVSGRFEGDITVNGRLTITATGSITGSVSYKELAVEAGATIDGKMSPLVSKGAGKKPEKHTAGNKGSRPTVRDSENDGSELPFSNGSAAAA